LRRRSVATIGAALLVLAGCGGGSDSESADSGGGGGTQSAPEVVRIVVPADSGLFWDIYVAEEEGMFEANGIESEVTLTPGPAPTIAALSGGAADVGAPFAEQALAAMEQGAPLSIFAGQSNRILATVVGARDVTSAADLQGQKVATSNVDDVVTILMDKALAEEGLEAGDFDKIIVGSSGERYQSLQSGAVGAVSLTAPIDRRALREGFPVLVEISEPGILTAHFGTDEFLEERPEVAAAYVRSMQQAVEWLLDPANEERAVEILVDRTKVDPADAQATYDLYFAEDVFLEGSVVDEDLLADTLAFLSSTGRVNGTPDPADYINRAALDAAAEQD